MGIVDIIAKTASTVGLLGTICVAGSDLYAIANYLAGENSDRQLYYNGLAMMLTIGVYVVGETLRRDEKD